MRLNQDGFLMLGKSEAVGASPELFSQIDKKYKIYTRKDTATRDMVNFGTIIPQLEKQNRNEH
jgi:two-component system, chemotaxis family, CheB/CheR fusion protein